jgi:hypothetical protein
MAAHSKLQIVIEIDWPLEEDRRITATICPCGELLSRLLAGQHPFRGGQKNLSP